MKKALLVVLLLVATTCVVNAQRGYGHHHYPSYGGYCGPRVVVTPFGGGCGNYYGRRPFINVVIAPRPRVVQPDPVYQQPRIVKEWVEAHWEETPNGRIWVEGHYIQREVY